MAIISDYKVTKIIPKVDKKYAHLLPLYPSETISFVLSGASNAVSNAFRRGPEELDAKYLETTNINSNDDYVILDFIINRIKAIPLQQSTTATTWTLSVANNTPERMTIYTHDITIEGKIKPFNNCVLLELNPGKQIYASGIVATGKSRIVGNGGITLASLCKSIYVDDSWNPNEFEDHKGTPSRQSNNQKWIISMIVPGHINATMLLQRICDDIITRAKAIKNIPIMSSRDLHEIILQDETSTMGELITRECDKINDLKYYSYKDDTRSFGITFTFRCDSDPRVIVDSMLDSIVDKFEKLKPQFR